MSSLRVLKTLVTERLTAAAEEILVLVERVMVEHEEQLIRRYRPAEERTSPDRPRPHRLTFTRDVQQFEGFHLQQQPDQEQLGPPTIKQEPEEEQEEVWAGPEVQAEAPQIKVEQDTKDFIYIMECKSEQPQVESVPSEEVLKVEVKDEDILPSTSFLPPPAAAQSEQAEGSSSLWCCKVCGKMFSYRGSLINHAEVHADDEHCFCGVCGQLLPDRRSLLDHLQTHVMAYVCYYCGKTFPRHLDLAVHTRCHTGEKPFGLHSLRQVLQPQGQLGDPHEDAHGREAVPLQRLRQVFQLHLVLDPPREDAHRREALQLPLLRQELPAEHAAEKPHEAPHGGAAVLLQRVQQELQRRLLAPTTHEDSRHQADQSMLP
ncbi:uncharacterized protein [Pagrus major]|uniref:uncharacterized protein n=1 Tax=Pagrus major TaxID=143350 RepID=UPI003CC8DE79